ncbi:MAG: motility associated factor glycosyltransferase family protein [Planctomycetota bacterium]
MDVTIDAQQQRWRRNLEVLREVAPALAGRLAALGADQRVPLEPTDSGFLSARITGEDGTAVRLASARDPLAEARRWVEGRPGADEAKHTVVVVGFALGYHVAELLDRHVGGLVVVLEPSLATTAAALRCHDFADALRLRRLMILAEVDRTGMHQSLGKRNVELTLGTQLTQHPASARAFPAVCGQLQRDLSDYLQYIRSALGTSLRISSITCDNILANLPYYLRNAGIDELKDRFRGRPAVCVAAGPSLRKDLHRLAEAKGRMVIIAVQTVLRTLLTAGIRPDFVTSLDYSPLSRRFYEGLGDLDDITLIADPKVNAIVPESFPGPVRLFRNEFADGVLAERADPRDGLPTGATVAHLNLYLARYLGCDPIVLLGQDLGFGGNIYYTPGVPLHQAWAPELNRFNTLEMMEWQRIVRFRPHLRRVASNDGREIYTDAQMFTYLQQFDRDVAETGATVINATTGGARIAAAEVMAFEEVLRRWAEPAAEVAIPLPVRYGDADERFARAIDCIGNRRRELDRMAEICRQVLDPLRRMTDALDDPKRFNRLHERMDPWRRKIDSVRGVYRLVGDFVRLAELRRAQADLTLAARDVDEITERREQLARDIQYVTLLAEGIEQLRESLDRAAVRLERKP